MAENPSGIKLSVQLQNLRIRVMKADFVELCVPFPLLSPLALPLPEAVAIELPACKRD